jgi:hypothetical protein
MKKTILYFEILVFTTLVLIPVNAFSGSTGPSYLNIDTQSASFQLFYYWDLRGRDSSFMVFNSSSETITVHVQIYLADNGINDTDCEEIDFIDTYTPQDAHIYDLRDLTRNNSEPLTFVLSEGSFGFAVVSVVEDFPDVDTSKPVLIGNFRIVDNSGYEYRVNAAGVNPIGFTTDSYDFNIEDYGTTTFSDVVGIPVKYLSTGFNTVFASPDIWVVFDPFIFDEDENVLSCSPVIFSCSTTGLNKGIDNARPNSKNATRICNTSLSDGHMVLSQPLFPAPSDKQADFFIGFIGLNNGGEVGSMSAFIAAPPF